MPRPIVTLTTDFGSSDYYVGAMKGVILSVCPEAEIIDLCHHCLPYDVLDAAFTLAQSYAYYPPRTVHVVVVDPGVGTERRPILVRGDRHFFVAPDNGVLTLIYAQQEKLTVYHITSEHYFRRPVSHTFHARDIFASVTGWLARGLEPRLFGEEIKDYARLAVPKAQAVMEKSWKGVVLKVDRFGNLITNIAAADCPTLFATPTPRFKLTAGGKEITKLLPNYAAGRENEVFALLGSSGYLEIATNRGGAARLLGLNRGAEVTLELI
ncbi:MAG: S-adenosyl-l-methionine hydroxide adenosyltransferase family protein [Terriglobia bacterium]